MNESQLISELCAALDDEAASVRALAGTAERARKKARGRRLTGGLAASALVVGLALGLVVGVGGSQAPPRPSAARPSASPAGTARLTAVDVLDRAAASALAQPTVVPRPDQFVFWKTVDSVYGTAETWRSVDGSRNGFVLAQGRKVMLWGCSNGWQTVQPDPGSGLKSITQRCIAEPVYLPDMPVSSDKMQDYLTRNFGSGLDGAAVAQKATEVLLDQDYLLPAQRAALYRFFVTTPGLKVIPGARDYIGRRGVGVSLTTDGFTAIWIFDPKTFAYLGSVDLVGGKLTSGSAVLKVAIVAKAGQRP